MIHGRRNLPAEQASRIRLAIPVLTLMVCAGCDSLSNSTTPSTSPPGVPLTVLTQSAQPVTNVPKTVVCYGRLVPESEALLSFARAGVMEILSCSVGQKVNSGAVLATLNQGNLPDRQRIMQEDVARIRSALASAPQVETRSLRQQLQQSESQLQAIDAELARGTIVSPFNGVIKELRVEVSGGVRPGMPVVYIVSDSPPQLEISANEALARQLNNDAEVSVVFPEGTVTAVAALRTSLRGPFTGELIRLRMTDPFSTRSWEYEDIVEARFQIPSDDSGFLVPITGLQRGQSADWSVYVAEPMPNGDDRFSRVVSRTVQVRRILAEQALVSGDLQTGDQLIVSGTHRVVVDQQVQIINRGSDADAVIPMEPEG